MKSGFLIGLVVALLAKPLSAQSPPTPERRAQFMAAMEKSQREMDTVKLFNGRNVRPTEAGLWIGS